MARYTTVKEMGDKVNDLYELLAKAKEITKDLICDNARNKFTLMYAPNSPEAQEQRPLSLEERIKEAEKYEKAFTDLRGMIARAESFIARKY